MKSIEMTAKTTEEAISAGLEQLGVSLSDVKVDIVEEGSKGLFGLFGSRPAKVRLTLTEEDDADEVHDIFANSLDTGKTEPKPAPADAPVQPKPEAPAKKAPAKAKAPKAKAAAAEARRQVPGPGAAHPGSEAAGMRRFFYLALAALQLLLLAGKGGVRGNYRELEQLLVIQTMGVDTRTNGVTLSLAAKGDSEQGV